MAETMEGEQRRLDAYRQSLEDRVEERTRDLSAANEALEARDRERRVFLADIGHELRTPLTVLRGEAEIALRARTEPEIAQVSALQKVVDITGQMTRLVNDLFTMARAEAGMLDMRRDRVDLADVAAASVEELRHWAEGENAELHYAGPTDGVPLLADEVRLFQVLRILITNAVQHGGDAPRVRVEIAEDADVVHLTVADNGPGIPEDAADQIFERFYRAGRTSARHSSGNSGLGLPIARTLVEAHGGTITLVPPESGTGAVFRLTFRRAQQIARDDTAAA